jgi:hypothetical protein
MAGTTRRAFSAAGVDFRINGKKVGAGQSVRGTITITNQPVGELGNIDLIEHVPTQRLVNFSVGIVRLAGRSLKAQGFWPSGGTLDVLNFAEMVAEIWDRRGGSPIYTFEGVRPASHDFSIDLGGILMENAAFDARFMPDSGEDPPLV